MIDLNTLLVGSDAEIPVLLVDGTPFPVTGLVGGTKNEPRRIKKLPEGFFVQEDNSNLEFNIPPAKTAGDLEYNFDVVIRALKRELPPTMKLGFGQSVVEYKAEFLNNPACQAFGCTPDYNVYTREENPRPKAANKNMRTAAAHIHVGWDKPNNEDRAALVKMLDATVGYFLVGMDDVRRKEMYGRAGAFRPKKYGVEYRVVDNQWLAAGYPSAVFGYVRKACELVNQKVTFTPEEEAAIIEAINTGMKSRKVNNLITAKTGIYI
jgi:hypothetical protein